jgi:hypothetical protein
MNSDQLHYFSTYLAQEFLFRFVPLLAVGLFGVGFITVLGLLVNFLHHTTPMTPPTTPLVVWGQGF